MTPGTTTCHKCKTPVVISASETWEGKMYHVKCLREVQGKRALYDYLNEKAKATIDWSRVTSQCKHFMRIHKYTYEDLLLAARYQFEVLQPKGPRSEEHARGIGLLPHIMEDAKAHWAEEEKRQKSIAKQMESMGEQQTITVSVKPTVSEKKLLDPLTILGVKEGG